MAAAVVSPFKNEAIDGYFFNFFADDCCLLPSEVQMPNVNPFYPSRNTGVALTATFPRNSPLQVIIADGLYFCLIFIS